ncbi:hypothetical protein WAI453_009250 [Rhynchosporium graminicola]|uniref:BTB domain-containing protein n=1 Tax=Rhynchosporium graminicola TaxID=2792576 RepID=A0A1E1KRG0_9HELO|nr:uncharacterized protein RCO7_03028 [Rhynchosporium commune]
MAADLLIEMKDDKGFIERLRSSSMIEIKCRNHTTEQDIIVRIPEAIACSLSGRISELVGNRSDATTNLDMEGLMGRAGDLDVFEDFFRDNLLSYLTCFVQWIYTSKLNYDKELPLFNMWIFAVILECPRLQNETVRMLSRDALWRSNVSLGEKKQQYYFANHRFPFTIFFCERLAENFKDKDTNGFREDGGIDVKFWENKKYLLFLLDCAAYFGLSDRRVLDTIDDDCSEGLGNLSIMIMKRMVQLAKIGGEMCPWDPKNIGRYLVTEQRAKNMAMEVPAVQTPLRKRPVMASGSAHAAAADNGNKRVKAVSGNVQIKQSPSAEKRLSDVSKTLVGEDDEGSVQNRRS